MGIFGNYLFCLHKQFDNPNKLFRNVLKSGNDGGGN